MNDLALAAFLSALDDDLAREDHGSPFGADPIGSGDRMYRAMERLAHAGVGDDQAAELLRADVERRSFMAARRSRIMPERNPSLVGPRPTRPASL